MHYRSRNHFTIRLQPFRGGRGVTCLPCFYLHIHSAYASLPPLPEAPSQEGCVAFHMTGIQKALTITPHAQSLKRVPFFLCRSPMSKRLRGLVTRLSASSRATPY
ncbi:unnamed protein product [Pylaiella littoralis]